MKTKGYVNELMGKTADELQKDLVSAKKELFNLRFQNATNQAELRKFVRTSQESRQSSQRKQEK